MRSLARDGYHFILDGRGNEELYDVVADTDEQHDRSKELDVRDVLDGMRSDMNGLLPQPGPR